MSVGAILLVLAGGFVGGVARFLISGVVAARVGEFFPWGTLAVNVSGSLAIGLFAGLASAGAAPFAGELSQAFLITGLCGGYTTVSSFALQTLALAQDRESRRALGNVLASAGLTLVAVAAGVWAATAIA